MQQKFTSFTAIRFIKLTVSHVHSVKALSTLATIVAESSATVLAKLLATVAEFGESPFQATI